MAIDKQTVEYVAHLARLELDSKELGQLSGQLQEIVKFIDKIRNLDLKNTPPTSHILPIDNVLREDESRKSLPCNKALMNAAQQKNGFFGVPKVIE